MLYKICNRCNRKVKQGEVCDCRVKSNLESQRRYDRTKRSQESSKIYRSERWRRVVSECKSICHGLDLYSFYFNNRIEQGELVHHIEEVTERPDLAFELSNLIYVTNKAHGKIHRAYEKSEEEKEKMKNVLKECLQRHGGG